MPTPADADEAYLNAVEAAEDGTREAALEFARTAVGSDPEHTEAWWLVSSLSLPPKERPDLAQASISLNACRKVITLDPEHEEAWIRGGRLLSDELGMYDKALEWWHQRRLASPSDTQAVIETVALLADLGLYHQAIDELQRVWEPGMRQLTFEQEKRLARLHNLVKKVAADEARTDFFRPWNPRDEGWGIIRSRMHRGPANETLIYLFLVMPVLLLVVMGSPDISQAGFSGLAFSVLIMLIIVMGGMRIARKLAVMMNRPAFNLIRAMDVETTAAKTVIEEDIRSSRLYGFLLKNRPPAFGQRLAAIIESGEALSASWRPTLPDFSEALSPLEEE